MEAYLRYPIQVLEPRLRAVYISVSRHTPCLQFPFHLVGLCIYCWTGVNNGLDARFLFCHKLSSKTPLLMLQFTSILWMWIQNPESRRPRRTRTSPGSAVTEGKTWEVRTSKDYLYFISLMHDATWLDVADLLRLQPPRHGGYLRVKIQSWNGF